MVEPPEPPAGHDAPHGAGAVRLVILYGGQSAEHEVSCISGLQVARAAVAAGYDVGLVGITADGRWLDASPHAAAALDAGSPAAALPSPDDLHPPGHPHEVGVRTALLRLRQSDDRPLVVFPTLHGPMGEDGTVQGFLELAGVAYIGSGVAASATAMDKGLAKQAIAAAGLPQVRYLLRRDIEIDPLFAKVVEAELGWPVFVKPANMGSSVGISRVEDAGGLDAALALAFRYDEFVVVEEEVVGREIEVGVLGWPDIQVSVPGEVVATHGFYDFDDKYLAGTAALRVPADLPAEVAATLPGLAAAACRALRVDGMARVDFFYEEAGRGLLVNEINTIPGFTPASLYPRLWAASGVDYGQLIDTLVDAASKRHRRRNRFERFRD